MCKVFVDACGGDDGTHRTRLRAGSVASASPNALRGTSKGPNASDFGNLPGAQSHQYQSVLPFLLIGKISMSLLLTTQWPTGGRPKEVWDLIA